MGGQQKKKTLIDFKRALGCALSKHMGLLNKIKAKTNIKGKDSTQKATQKQEEGVGVLEKRIEEVDKELNEINKAIGYFEGQLKASLVLLRDKSKANAKAKQDVLQHDQKIKNLMPKRIHFTQIRAVLQKRINSVKASQDALITNKLLEDTEGLVDVSALETLADSVSRVEVEQELVNEVAMTMFDEQEEENDEDAILKLLEDYGVEEEEPAAVQVPTTTAPVQEVKGIEDFDLLRQIEQLKASAETEKKVERQADTA